MLFTIFTRLAKGQSINLRLRIFDALKLKTTISNDERLVLVIDISKGNSIGRHCGSSLARHGSLDGTEQRLLWPEVQLRLLVFFLVFAAASAIM